MKKRSIREVSSAYKRMIEQEEDPVQDKKVNVYRCIRCKTNTVTKDCHTGTTPMLIPCPNCGDMARSSFYEVDQTLEPSIHFYRPSLKKVLKMRKKEHQQGELEHVLNGGLLMRDVKTK